MKRKVDTSPKGLKIGEKLSKAFGRQVVLNSKPITGWNLELLALSVHIINLTGIVIHLMFCWLYFEFTVARGSCWMIS